MCRKLGKVLTFKFQKKRETNLLKEMLYKSIDDYNTNIKITDKHFFDTALHKLHLKKKRKGRWEYPLTIKYHEKLKEGKAANF